MKESDFFVELLDDEEANQILECFNEKVIHPKKTVPLDKKKQHIRQIFRKQTPKIRRKKGPDPFYYYINTYKEIPSIRTMTAQEYFTMMQESSDLNATYRFGQGLIHFTEEIRKYLPTMLKNLEEGKDIFDLGYSLQTIEEAKDYYKQHHIYMCKEKKNVILKEAAEHFDEDDKKMIEELKKVFKGVDFLEVHKKVIELRDDYPLYCLWYSYIDTHPEEESEILDGLLFSVAMNLLRSKVETLDEFLSSEFKNSLEKDLSEQFGEIIEGLTNDVNRYKDQNKDLQRKLKSAKQEEAKQMNHIRQLNEKTEEMKKEIEKCLENEKNKRNQLIETHNQEIEHFRKENGELQKKVKKATQIQEMLQGADTQENFAVVYTLPTTLIESIYPEVFADHYSNWSKFKKVVERNGIKTLFVQRNNMSTRKVRQITKEAEELGAEVDMFRAQTAKEVLEYVGYFKVKNREENRI